MRIEISNGIIDVEAKTNGYIETAIGRTDVCMVKGERYQVGGHQVLSLR